MQNKSFKEELSTIYHQINVFQPVSQLSRHTKARNQLVILYCIPTTTQSKEDILHCKSEIEFASLSRLRSLSLNY